MPLITGYNYQKNILKDSLELYQILEPRASPPSTVPLEVPVVKTQEKMLPEKEKSPATGGYVFNALKTPEPLSSGRVGSPRPTNEK